MQRMLNVIDMYYRNAVNPVRDFAALKNAGVLGIIHKCTQGIHFADPLYKDRKKAAQDAGLLWAGYHFMDATDAAAQADWFLSHCGISSDAPDGLTGLWADYENNVGNQAALHQLLTFMNAVDGFVPGVSCGLYSGNLIRETLKAPVGGHQAPAMQGAAQFFQMHRLWLAEYGPHENIPYPWNLPVVKSSGSAEPMPAPGIFLWQFTGNARIPQLQGETDGSFFDGTFEQLKARWLA